ncbi:IDEAL domain-containing protein [Priestia megaterium]|nr:IDEAL domain-containing protein [Priestia megaterium]MCA4158013.1 IDEAL domain-containing protein [Priestia megaterium]
MDQVVKNFKKSKILEGIGQSLKSNDEATFLCFTEELKAVSYKE